MGTGVYRACKPFAIVAALLVLPLVICLCASCQTPEQRALALVRDCGGSFLRDESLPGRPVVGVDFIAVGMPLKSLSDKNIEAIEALTELRSVELNGARITDAGLKHLKGLTHLQHLGLSATYISDAGLIDLLSVIKGLRKLDLDSTQITGIGLKAASEQEQLYELHASCDRITDAEMKIIKRMRALGYLWLVQTNITDAGLKELKEMSNLQHLSLGGTGITDAGLKELEEVKGLRWLDVGGTWVSRDGLSAFRREMPDTLVRYTHRPSLDRRSPPAGWVPPPIGG